MLAQSGVKRNNIFITTKVSAGFGNETDCLPSPSIALDYVTENLKQLGVAYVDLVLLHAPCQLSRHPVADPSNSNSLLWRGLDHLSRGLGVPLLKVVRSVRPAQQTLGALQFFCLLQTRRLIT